MTYTLKGKVVVIAAGGQETRHEAGDYVLASRCLKESNERNFFITLA